MRTWHSIRFAGSGGQSSARGPSRGHLRRTLTPRFKNSKAVAMQTIITPSVSNVRIAKPMPPFDDNLVSLSGVGEIESRLQGCGDVFNRDEDRSRFISGLMDRASVEDHPLLTDFSKEFSTSKARNAVSLVRSASLRHPAWVVPSTTAGRGDSAFASAVVVEIPSLT